MDDSSENDRAPREPATIAGLLRSFAAFVRRRVLEKYIRRLN